MLKWPRGCVWHFWHLKSVNVCKMYNPRENAHLKHFVTLKERGRMTAGKVREKLTIYFYNMWPAPAKQGASGVRQVSHFTYTWIQYNQYTPCNQPECLNGKQVLIDVQLAHLTIAKYRSRWLSLTLNTLHCSSVLNPKISRLSHATRSLFRQGKSRNDASNSGHWNPLWFNNRKLSSRLNYQAI